MSEKIVTIDGEQREIALEREANRMRAGEYELEILSTSGDELELSINGRTFIVPYVIDGTTVSFAFYGDIWFADVAEKGARARARHRDHSTSAPMPGLVLKILVATGDVVAKGTALLILEAMKMEHQIIAPHAGRIDAIHCTEGELVQPGVELVAISEESQPEVVTG